MLPAADDNRKGAAAPILDHNAPAAASVFAPDALLREARRQKGLAPSEFAEADPDLVAKAAAALQQAGMHPLVDASWTTDAPFRETAEAIAAARAKGALAVEMEAAALYRFARTRGTAVLCLAHVTNTMGQAEQDFEKGEFDWTTDALQVLAAVMQALRSRTRPNRHRQA